MYKNLVFTEDSYYDFDAWLTGRTTAEKHFTHFNKVDDQNTNEEVPEGDFIVDEDLEKYYVVTDTSGKVGWEQDTIDIGDYKAKVLEVLVEDTSDSYKAYLRSLNIPYIISGQSEIDFKVMLDKLETHFNIKNVFLGGGAKLNWSMIQAGLCDELSVIISPILDGDSEAVNYVEPSKDDENYKPVPLELVEHNIEDDGTIWLRYHVKQ